MNGECKSSLSYEGIDKTFISILSFAATLII